MRNLLIGLGLGLLFVATSAYALSTTLVTQGGTGRTTFTSSQLIYGNGNAALSSVATTTVAGGTGISLSASPGALVGGSNLTITNTGVTSNVAGTGIGVSGATGAVTISNSGVLSITATSPIVRDTATGAVTISCASCLTAASGVTSITGTANQITASASVGAVTLSIPQRFIFPLSYESTYGTTTYASSTALTAGQLWSTNATTTSLYITGLLSGVLNVDANGQVYKAATTTWAGTGLTASGGQFNVNTSQNITTISNLTTNGLVTTSGSNGTLGATVNSTNGLILAMSGGIPTYVSTTTFSSGLLYSGGNVTNTGVLSVGVTGSVLTGAVLIATSSTAYNGLTASTTVTCAAQTCTFANTMAGTLGVAGGGTGAATLTGLISGNGTGAFTATANGTAGFVLAMSGGVPAWVATSTLSTITGTLTVGKGGTGLGTFGGTNTVLFTTAADTLSSATTFVYNSAAGAFGIGTSTPLFTLQVASSTAPQFTLSDASATNAPFNFRAINNSLYISTSSPSTFATTTQSLLAFDSSTGSTTIFKLDKSGTATSTFAGGIYLTAGCFSINGTCVGGSGTPGGSATELQYRNAGSFGAITNSAYTSQGVGNGFTGFGTTTPRWTLQVATSTQPQIALSDTTATNDHWTLRGISNNFFIATSSPSTFATSTIPALTIDNNGTMTLSRPLGVGSGGTGAITFTTNGVVYGNTASALQVTAQGGANTVLIANSGTPSFSAAPTIGTSVTTPILIGGSAIGSSLEHRATSGAGVGAEFIKWTLGNNGALEAGRITEYGIGIGTTTPKWALTVASSTRAQFTLSDAIATDNHYSFRAINNWFYLSTSSPSTFATTTNPILSITPGGQVSTYALRPATSTAITLDWEQAPNQVEYRMGTAAYTITIINATTSRQWGATKRVMLCNPDSGTPGAATWAGVGWPSGTAPTQSNTVQICDFYSLWVDMGTTTASFKVHGAQTQNFQ